MVTSTKVENFSGDKNCSCRQVGTYMYTAVKNDQIFDEMRSLRDICGKRKMAR